jgi:hypothetical protein
MRNALLILGLSAASLLACSKKQEATPTTTTTSATPAIASPATATATVTATTSTTAAAPDIDVSPEMKGFMSMLDGSDGSAGKALKKYGAPSVQKNDLGMYSLKNPKVTKSEKLGVMQCYTMESEAGIMKHETKVCWDSKGKIAQITDKSS